MVHVCASVKEKSVQFWGRLDAHVWQNYGGPDLGFSIPTALGDGMKTLDGVRCALCGAASPDTPRLTVEQDRHYDCPLAHTVGLCATHGAALREGQVTPHQILYQWIQEHHDELYDGTRLLLMPRLTCLGCNAVFATSEETYPCPTCNTVNVIGTALGHPASIHVAK